MTRSVRDTRPKILRPVHPNVGIEASYRRKLEKLIDEMHRSLSYWLLAAYRANPPEMAQDDSPAASIRRVLSRLSYRWRRRFNTAADELAKHFATQAAQRSTASLEAILRKGGFSVKFRTSRAVNDILQATVAENVALIRSIPQQHLTAVEGHVMRSVQAGRDLKSLSDALQEQFGVTKRRAGLISLDQNNKCTAAIQRARQIELGLETAQWLHSGGGRHPRPTHVKAGRDRVIYNVREGWWDPAIQKFIWPGTEIGCRCTSRSIVAGLS